mgnify:CR=1 FL=1
MYTNAPMRVRGPESDGRVKILHGEYRASFLSGAVTLAAAETTTVVELNGDAFPGTAPSPARIWKS